MSYCSGISAQKIVVFPKAYAFSRQVLGGMKPTITPDETGKSFERIAIPSVQYFIYVMDKPGSPFDLNNIWIKGKLYDASVNKEKAPIIITNNSMPGKNTDTLFAGTKNNVWRIQVKGVKKPGSITGPLQQLLSQNEVVIEYKGRPKTKVLTVREIKKLSDVALQ